MARTRSRRTLKVRPRQAFGLAREAIAFVGQLENHTPLNENPNRGKHGASRQTDAFLQELADAIGAAYSPLTVATPLRDSRGRRNPRMGHSRYTV